MLLMLRQCRHLTPRRLRLSRIHERSRSREADRNNQTKGLPNTSLGPYRLRPFFLCTRFITRERRESDVRAEREERMAYAPARSNLDRDGRQRLDSAV